MRYLVCIIAIFLAGCASQNSPTEALDPSVNVVEAAKTRVSLGLTYLKNGNYTSAKTNLDKALAFAPRLSDAHFAMAYYYQTVSEFELADQYFNQAIALDRRNPDLLNSYGAFLCQTGEYAKAKEFLLRAVQTKQYANAAETYENLAICSHSQTNIDEAIDYLSTALQHQPGRAKSWYMFIELLIAKERWQEAKVAYRQYEKVVPVTADTLALAIEIEEGLGNRAVADGYANMLHKLYPDRANTKRTQLLRPVVKQQNKVPVAIDNNGIRTHIVQKGENLYRIALQYKVRMQWLIEWNDLVDASALAVGQTIYVSDPNN